MIPGISDVTMYDMETFEHIASVKEAYVVADRKLAMLIKVKLAGPARSWSDSKAEYIRYSYTGLKSSIFSDNSDHI